MTTSRTVRVFLSSTFRDFAEERDLLVRKIFPELRRKCRERQVELVDVDLRWGITEKEAQQGKVLPICLAEVDRSRPWFMGFIGERYGWIPQENQYDISLLMEQPWLEEYRGGKSVTELEILHGVLNNPKMAGRAFFYFRDPKWSQKKGGDYLSEGSLEKDKLDALKDRIRNSGFPVVEDYSTPEALAERVKDDLWKLIDETFPESEVPDALTEERMRHEAYGATRRRLYLCGEKYFECLDGAMKEKPFRPVLITGEAGSGKTSLIANWLEAWQAKHVKFGVFVHYFGATADSVDPVIMVLRLIALVLTETGESLAPAETRKDVLKQLPDALTALSLNASRGGRPWLLVLDGIDKAVEYERLNWVPRSAPEGIHILITSNIGDASKRIQSDYWIDDGDGFLMQAPEWIHLDLEPFDQNERCAFIANYLGKFRKSLPSDLVERICNHPLGGRPIWLITFLEQLRVFGIHEKIAEHADALLTDPSSKVNGEPAKVDDIFVHVLAGLLSDSDEEMVSLVFKALWAESDGMSETALLEFSGLAPSSWAFIRNSLDENLIETLGKISIGTSFLRNAVADLWLPTEKSRMAIHLKLAIWYQGKKPDFSNLKRVVMHLIKSGDPQSMMDYIFRPTFFNSIPISTGGILCLEQGFRATGMEVAEFLDRAEVAWKDEATDRSAYCVRFKTIRRALNTLNPVEKSFDEARKKIIEIEGKYGKFPELTRIRKLDAFVDLSDSGKLEATQQNHALEVGRPGYWQGSHSLQQLVEDNLGEDQQS